MHIFRVIFSQIERNLTIAAEKTRKELERLQQEKVANGTFMRVLLYRREVIGRLRLQHHIDNIDNVVHKLHVADAVRTLRGLNLLNDD